MQSQRERAEKLRALHHQPEPLVLPNAWDAASARIFESVGCEAVATSSATVANSLGYADGQVIPRDEMLFVIRRIAQSVDVPVTADIEAGFGGSVDEIVETIRGVLDAGAVGVNFEDGLPDGLALMPILDQLDRIRAIRDLGEQVGVPLVINARTDAYLVPINDSDRLPLAIERANAYFDAGADCAYPILASPDHFASLVEQIRGPINILALPGVPAISELERMGVRRISLGAGPGRAAMGLTKRIADELRTGALDTMFQWVMPSGEANRLFEPTG